MLRPATPLSIIFLVAFVLLLLSTLSTPVIKGIPLGSFQGYNFGVLGYCKGDTCEGPRIGYSTGTKDGLFNGTNTEADFSLPSSTRNSLSAILVVHPIAALLCLICLGLGIAAHFHGPSHSPRYLLALLILTIPTLLVTLLAFLVDILLFVPHMQWGGWIVLVATILIIASSIVTCAMRRTLVSRKARKKRIAENADMNGQNYYENLAQNRMMVDSLPKADSPPPMSGSTAVDKNGSSNFATDEMKRQETMSEGGGRRSQDDSTPLNPTRDPSIRSASTNGGRTPYAQDPMAPPMPMDGRPRYENQNGMPRRLSRDQYGNPIPPGAEVGAMAAAGLRHQGSQGSLGSNPSQPSNGYPRGRGGYGPPPRGYGPPRGARGAYGPPRGGRGGYGPPPPPGFYRGRGGPPPGMMGRGGPPPMMGRGGPPPPGYGYDYSYGPPRSGPSPSYEQPSPPMAMPNHDQFVAGPVMVDGIGQAIEMDERHGSPQQGSPAPLNHAYDNGQYGLRDSDADVAGMIGLQQGQEQHDAAPHTLSPPPQDGGRQGDVRSPSSMYSDQTYVPPPTQWSAVPSPLDHGQHENGLLSRNTLDTNISSSSGDYSSGLPSSRVLSLSPVPASPTGRSARGSHSPRHNRAGSEAYYEDVDPRFAEEQNPSAFHAMSPADDMAPHNAVRDSGIPNALTPGPGQAVHYQGNQHLSPEAYATNAADHGISSSSVEGRLPLNDSAGHLEPIPDGARSPGEGSEASNFTSVSQRGINPNWRPGPPGGYAGSNLGPNGSSASAVQRRREDTILSANPDFSIPGVGLGGRGGGRGRGRGGTNALPPSALGGGLTPAGRYPTDI
ncbi:pH-response regulator protein palI/prr-5 [Fulvia fulva]|nr:pH-response regulator protein palI/prr-5 [Fulvia fulva]